MKQGLVLLDILACAVLLLLMGIVLGSIFAPARYNVNADSGFIIKYNTHTGESWFLDMPALGGNFGWHSLGPCIHELPSPPYQQGAFRVSTKKARE